MKPGTYVMHPKTIPPQNPVHARLSRRVRLEGIEGGSARITELTTRDPIWREGETKLKMLTKWEFVPVYS